MFRVGVVVGFFLLSLLAPSISSAADVAYGFEVVARHDLGARGMNAGLAIANDCAYVGSRGGHQGSLIVDISDPSEPWVIGEIPHLPGSTARELRADERHNLLVVLNFRLDVFTASPNTLDVYDVTDCRAPAPVGRVDFGDDLPHEFFLWTDPAPERAGRVLAFVAMWGYAPNLRVFDLSNPAAPAPIATWDAGPVFGVPAQLHSVSVTPEGDRAYLAEWNLGLMVLDTSAVTRAEANPELRLLSDPAARIVLPGSLLHSGVPIPGTDRLVTVQEIYGPGACPYGHLHVVDVANPSAMGVEGSYGIAENDPAACPTTAGLDGTFTTHNPLVVEELAFVSWYAGGLRVADLRVPAAPVEVAAFVPAPLPAVAADDFTLGSYPIRMWSYPIVRDGLIYVVDIRNGLYVLRYTGPQAAEIADIEFAQGNAT